MKKQLILCLLALALAGVTRGHAQGKSNVKDSIAWLAERRALLEKYNKPISICFYLQDGVEVLDFAGPMEVFAYANFRVYTVSRKKEPIVTQGIL
jgi:hypothetical protein